MVTSLSIRTLSKAARKERLEVVARNGQHWASIKGKTSGRNIEGQIDFTRGFLPSHYIRTAADHSNLNPENECDCRMNLFSPLKRWETIFGIT